MAGASPVEELGGSPDSFWSKTLSMADAFCATSNPSGSCSNLQVTTVKKAVTSASVADANSRLLRKSEKRRRATGVGAAPCDVPQTRLASNVFVCDGTLSVIASVYKFCVGKCRLGNWGATKGDN